MLQSDTRTAVQFFKQNLLLCVHMLPPHVCRSPWRPQEVGDPLHLEPPHECWSWTRVLWRTTCALSWIISAVPEQQVLPQSVLSWVWCLLAIPTTERLRREICQEFEARTSETPSPPPLPKSLGPQHLGNEYELISVGKLKVLNTELWCVTWKFIQKLSRKLTLYIHKEEQIPRSQVG